MRYMKNNLKLMLPIITASLLVVGCGDKIMKPSVSYVTDNPLEIRVD
jgi:beta-glucosidase